MPERPWNHDYPGYGPFHSQQCKVVARDCHRIISWIKRTFVNWNKDIVVNLHKSLIRPRLEYAVCAWSPFLARDINLLERVQRRITKLVPGLEDMEYETRLRNLGLLTLKTRRARCDLNIDLQDFKGAGGRGLSNGAPV